MINILGKEYHVEIERKRIRNIYLRVNEDTLLITAPFYVSDNDIYKFINEKSKWINKQFNKKEERVRFSKLTINDSIYYLGKRYDLLVLNGRNNIKIEEDRIVIFTSNTDEEYIRRLFYKKTSNTLLNIIKEKEGKYLDILRDYGYNLEPQYKIKVLNSMWGVNYPNKNQINMSNKLIHFDIEIIEAVLWHELLHFVIPNHSKRFHQILSNHMANYEELMKKLY